MAEPNVNKTYEPLIAYTVLNLIFFFIFILSINYLFSVSTLNNEEAIQKDAEIVNEENKSIDLSRKTALAAFKTAAIVFFFLIALQGIKKLIPEVNR
jgi:archaellum biogenesis protein FlaJ (TadC family)